VEIVEVPQIEAALHKRIGEQARVKRLLAAEADLFEFDVGETQEARGS
jgi:hypothetical protein